jgi:hypothetical protein
MNDFVASSLSSHFIFVSAIRESERGSAMGESEMARVRLVKFHNERRTRAGSLRARKGEKLMIILCCCLPAAAVVVRSQRKVFFVHGLLLLSLLLLLEGVKEFHLFLTTCG